jgi:flagellar basal-body rod protein FlgB
MKNDPTRGLGVKNPEFTSQLFTRSMNIMGKSLALRQGRHGMITTNLANLDTPGYRVRDLKFEKVMAEAVSGMDDRLGMEYTHVNHMPNPSLDRAYLAAQRNVKFSIYGTDEKGEDAVDIDQEMTKLSKNQLVYNATVQMLAKEFELLKYAISEGGR